MAVVVPVVVPVVLVLVLVLVVVVVVVGIWVEDFGVVVVVVVVVVVAMVVVVKTTRLFCGHNRKSRGKGARAEPWMASTQMVIEVCISTKRFQSTR